jgi:hypothetical protein
MFLQLSKSHNRFATMVMTLVLVLFLGAVIITTTVQAGTTCGGWHDTGQCCDAWWPGFQDWQENHCATCTTDGCVEFTNNRCNTFSQCP